MPSFFVFEPTKPHNGLWHVDRITCWHERMLRIWRHLLRGFGYEGVFHHEANLTTPILEWRKALYQIRYLFDIEYVVYMWISVYHEGCSSSWSIPYILYRRYWPYIIKQILTYIEICSNKSHMFLPNLKTSICNHANTQVQKFPK